MGKGGQDSPGPETSALSHPIHACLHARCSYYTLEGEEVAQQLSEPVWEGLQQLHHSLLRHLADSGRRVTSNFILCRPAGQAMHAGHGDTASRGPQGAWVIVVRVAVGSWQVWRPVLHPCRCRRWECQSACVRSGADWARVSLGSGLAVYVGDSRCMGSVPMHVHAHLEGAGGRQQQQLLIRLLQPQTRRRPAWSCRWCMLLATATCQLATARTSSRCTFSYV